MSLDITLPDESHLKWRNLWRATDLFFRKKILDAGSWQPIIVTRHGNQSWQPIFVVTLSLRATVWVTGTYAYLWFKILLINGPFFLLCGLVHGFYLGTICSISNPRGWIQQCTVCGLWILSSHWPIESSGDNQLPLTSHLHIVTYSWCHVTLSLDCATIVLIDIFIWYSTCLFFYVSTYLFCSSLISRRSPGQGICAFF